MKLTNVILDLGRPVAYYPGLKRLTQSTTATVLLCQLLYWSDKSRDHGWIWKTSDQLEEETGLTINEQITAKKVLCDLHLIEKEFKRLDHSTRYRVNQDELNRQWELITGNKSEEIQKDKIKEPVGMPSIEEEIIEDEISASEFFGREPIPQIKKEFHTKVEKKGDLVDGLSAYVESEGFKKLNKVNDIKDRIEKKLHVNISGKKWQEFVEFAYEMDKKGESIDSFIEYALRSGYDPIYWPPEKMRNLWPQAFMDKDKYKVREDFVDRLPERKEEEYAPMPKDIGKVKQLH